MAQFVQVGLKSKFNYYIQENTCRSWRSDCPEPFAKLIYDKIK